MDKYFSNRYNGRTNSNTLMVIASNIAAVPALLVRWNDLVWATRIVMIAIMIVSIACCLYRTEEPSWKECFVNEFAATIAVFLFPLSIYANTLSLSEEARRLQMNLVVSLSVFDAFLGLVSMWVWQEAVKEGTPVEKFFKQKVDRNGKE